MSGSRLNKIKCNFTLSFWRTLPDLQNKREKGICVDFFWKHHTPCVSLYTTSISACESKSRPTRCFTHATLPIHTCFPRADHKCPGRECLRVSSYQIVIQGPRRKPTILEIFKKQFNLPLSYTSLKEIAELNEKSRYGKGKNII